MPPPWLARSAPSAPETPTRKFLPERRDRTSLPSVGKIASADQIQQREQKNPHNIDEVPVQADHLQRRVIHFVKPVAPGHDRDDQNNRNSDDHVQRVQPSHEKIKAEK